eukprot:2574388-Amphidinium_carterae.1
MWGRLVQATTPHDPIPLLRVGAHCLALISAVGKRDFTLTQPQQTHIHVESCQPLLNLLLLSMPEQTLARRVVCTKAWFQAGKSRLDNEVGIL